MSYDYVPIFVDGEEVNDIRKGKKSLDLSNNDYLPPSETQKNDNRLTLEQWIYFRGFNKSKIAKAIGCSRATVTQWCKGEHLPSGLFMTRLCEILDLDWNQIRKSEAQIYFEDYGTSYQFKPATTTRSRARW